VTGFATFGADSRTDWYAALRGPTSVLYGAGEPGAIVGAGYQF